MGCFAYYVAIFEVRLARVSIPVIKSLELLINLLHTWIFAVRVLSIVH